MRDIYEERFQTDLSKAGHSLDTSKVLTELQGTGITAPATRESTSSLRQAALPSQEYFMASLGVAPVAGDVVSKANPVTAGKFFLGAGALIAAADTYDLMSANLTTADTIYKSAALATDVGVMLGGAMLMAKMKGLGVAVGYGSAILGIGLRVAYKPDYITQFEREKEKEKEKRPSK